MTWKNNTKHWLRHSVGEITIWVFPSTWLQIHQSVVFFGKFDGSMAATRWGEGRSKRTSDDIVGSVICSAVSLAFENEGGSWNSDRISAWWSDRWSPLILIDPWSSPAPKSHPPTPKRCMTGLPWAWRLARYGLVVKLLGQFRGCLTQKNTCLQDRISLFFFYLNIPSINYFW